MFRPRILFADNNRDFLDARAEFFHDRYEVVKAHSVEEASAYLQTNWVHLAIFDLRLTEDNDAHDNSGLILARESPAAIPKIILTGNPTVSLIREAFRDIAVVDFLDKAEGAKAMLQAVENAFAKHVRINWDLSIQFKSREPSSFVHLVSLIDPQLEGERLLSRTEELTDLFRRLFFEKQQIRIDRLLWQKNGRLALTVFAFNERASQEAFVVVCGTKAAVKMETQRYRDSAPKAAENLSTVLSAIAETTHFAANAYSLAGANLETVQSLKDRFRTDSEKAFQATLTTLLQKILVAWQQEQSFRENTKTLAEVYAERIAWPQKNLTQQALEDRVEVLLYQVPTQASLQGVQLSRASRLLTVRFHERIYTYPDPFTAFPWKVESKQPVLLVNTPGELAGETIFSGEEGRAWLTDFSRAGLAPLLWNFIALEALLRFDWLEAAPLQWRHALERCLVSGDFSRLDQFDLEPQMKKIARSIQLIRKAAAPIVGIDPRPYHLGLLFQAANRLLEYDPKLPLTSNELTRFIHLLIVVAVLYGKVSQDQEEKQRGLLFSKKDQLFMLNGAPLHLSGQHYALLSMLYEHADKPCSRSEVFERVFQQKYDENNSSHGGRLDTAIRRLREKIEIDPSRPRYLLTDPRGYRLVPKGEG